jgi:hypothetical protein
MDQLLRKAIRPEYVSRILRPDAFLVPADTFLASQRSRIAQFAIENKLPSVYLVGACEQGRWNFQAERSRC